MNASATTWVTPRVAPTSSVRRSSARASIFSSIPRRVSWSSSAAAWAANDAARVATLDNTRGLTMPRLGMENRTCWSMRPCFPRTTPLSTPSLGLFVAASCRRRAALSSVSFTHRPLCAWSWAVSPHAWLTRWATDAVRMPPDPSFITPISSSTDATVASSPLISHTSPCSTAASSLLVSMWSLFRTAPWIDLLNHCEGRPWAVGLLRVLQGG
ncbi:hypothetical protein ACFFX0_25645 [Citricoccus parietis]|uniref:Uncharacterized protein n=1 Tax=Citricoccus parietis TaxID=592307 RepID=A0ABV5G649_9MICC